MNSMDVIYLLMNCVVTASIIVAIASALWSMLVLLIICHYSHYRGYNTYVIWNKISRRMVEMTNNKICVYRQGGMKNV